MNDQELILSYNNLIPFDYNSALIESDGANALLKKIDNPALEFNQPFTSDSGFTYNSNLAEFVAGILRQKDLRHDNATFAATYNLEINGNWGNGILTGTPMGGAAILNGKLDLAHDDIRYVDYDANGNADSQQVGTIKFKLTPNWSGHPSTHQSFFNICKAHNDLFNSIYLTQDTSGKLYFYFHDQSGVACNAELGIWNHITNQEYEFEINFDFTIEEQRLFIDGVQFGPTATKTLIRSSDIGLLRIGNIYNACCSTNFKIDDFIYFSTVQHTANYTPGYQIKDYIHLGSRIDYPIFNYSDIGNIQAWESLATTIIGNPKFIHNNLYHDGNNWIASDGSYNQSNTLTEAQAAITFLPLNNTMNISTVFEDSNIQQSIDLYRLFYTGQKYSLLAPPIMVLLGKFLDGIGIFTIESTLPANTSLKFSINISNVNYYHDGANWVLADGTVAQANTLTELNSKISDFDFGLGKLFKLKVFLVTTDDQVTPKLFKITMTYDFAIQPNYPATCKMYGFVVDNSGVPVEGAVVTFSSDDFYSGENKVTKDVTVTTDANGAYDKDLVRTINLGLTMNQNIRYSIGDNKYDETDDKFRVPNEDAATISDNLA